MSTVEGGAYVASFTDTTGRPVTQGQILTPLITTDTAGARRLSIGGVVMPPGALSRAHLHAEHEMVVVCVRGVAATLLGDDLLPIVHGPGEFVFIPPGLVHVAVNLSTIEALVAVEARSDPGFNDDVWLTPSYDHRAQQIATNLRALYTAGLLPTRDGDPSQPPFVWDGVVAGD